MKKAIALAVTLIIMGTIFYFSAQPGEASYELSKEIAIDVEDGIFAGLVPVIFSEDMNANIRKWAHILAYFTLGVSMAITVLAFDDAREQGSERCRFCAVPATAFCLLYAISDEVHQLFVPARAGLISDVILDLIGSLPGVLLVTFWTVHKIKKNNTN